jgi:hypothetical protein
VQLDPVVVKQRDALTKNDHFQAMLKEAHRRGFVPACVVFDSWYSGLDNLKLIRSFGWVWLTRLKSNRKVNPDRTGLPEQARGPQGRRACSLLPARFSIDLFCRREYRSHPLRVLFQSAGDPAVLTLKHHILLDLTKSPFEVWHAHHTNLRTQTWCKESTCMTSF